MPTTYTHDIFGKVISQKLPEDVKSLVSRCQNSYLIGLHGPDILFYYDPHTGNQVHKLGIAMHAETASTFFLRCKELYLKTKDDEVLAYTIGFICHFMLDSTCHPFISSYIERTGARHDEIESELDRYLMEHTGLNPFRYQPARHLKAKKESIHAIAEILGITDKQAKKALCGLKRYTAITVCRTSFKRNMLLGMLKASGFYDEVQGHIIRKKKLKRCTESTEELLRLFKLTVPETITVIDDYYRTISDTGYLNSRFERNYE